MDPLRLHDSIEIEFSDYFCGSVTRGAAPGEFLLPTAELSPRLTSKLDSIGAISLYSHQALAFDEALAGKDVVVVTGTNSGKTLCYNLPVIHRLLEEPNSHALYLFPTKALAQDQLGKLEQFTQGLGIGCSTYDGDTPTSKRGLIRKNAQIVLTNPDMLHVGILPQYESWLKFLRSLRFIVMDEIHAYRGIFGSHVGNIVRRLLRLCQWQNSNPQIIACSATIANPIQHFQVLTGREPTLIRQDGAARAERTYLFLSSGDDEERLMSPNKLTSSLLASCVHEGARTLAFCRSREAAELVLRQSRRIFEGLGGNPELIESYRGGYSPKERRDIEKRLFGGDLVGLSTTNAMELGVDVGDLDTVVINGYPGSLSSFFQQAGRAGRGQRPGTALFVARQDPLDQFLVREPGELFQRPIEHVSANPQNPHILRSQLLCAAYERPLDDRDLKAFGESAAPLGQEMVESGELADRLGRLYYPLHEAPAPKMDIRGLNGPTMTLRCGSELIGSAEYWRAVRSLYPGAVYLHRSRSFVVQELNLESHIVEMNEEEVGYFTRSAIQSFVEPRFVISTKEVAGRTVDLVALQSTTLVLGYQAIEIATDARSGVIELELPPQIYDTVGIRIQPDLALDEEAPESAGSALHALEHALVAVAPLVAGCDRADLGSAWPLKDLSTNSAAIYVFDATPGGMGLSEKLFEAFEDWAMNAYRLLKGCTCEFGCPACLLSPTCEISNQHLDKKGALMELEAIARTVPAV